MTKRTRDSKVTLEEKLGMPLCRVPFAGITVSPVGKMVMCCSSAHYPIGDISEIEDLTDWFNNNQELIEARSDMVHFKKLPQQCASCFNWRTQDVPMTRWAKRIVPWNDEDFKKGEWPITFLEVTASNVCNQSCVMCNSFFSSKWVNLDKKAIDEGLTFRSDERYPDGPKKYRLSDRDVDKLIGILPSVQSLVLKGGEPFADPSNMRILEAASRLEKPPFVTIVTNGAVIPDSAFELLESYRGDLDLGLSYDGIGLQYEWVRSTPFEKTLKMIDRICEIKRNRSYQTNISILKSVTLYTSFNLNEAAEFWTNYDEINCVFIRPAHRPSYASPQILPQGRLLALQERWSEMKKNPKIEFHSTLMTIESFEKVRPSWFYEGSRQVIPWIRFMNKQRGFEIEKIVPELETFLCTLPSA